MTGLLEKAIAALEKLPPENQDAIAAVILEEVLDEQQWDASFARSQDALAELAAKARADIAAGRVRPMGFDEL
jgi:hypothetical protein